MHDKYCAPVTDLEYIFTGVIGFTFAPCPWFCDLNIAKHDLCFIQRRYFESTQTVSARF